MQKDWWAALQHVEGMHPNAFFKLVETLGSPEAAWKTPAGELERLGALSPAMARKLMEARKAVNPSGLTARLRDRGIATVAIYEDAYPETLKNIDRPAPMLFYRGDLPAKETPAVAIVGSRRCTGYGREAAREIAAGLAEAGVTVVSGLAQGIDTAAHRGALEAGGKTVAVLGSGFDHIYPQANEPLANEIANSGCLLTEFAPHVKPDKWNFPFRNRLISGLSLGVTIVEAGPKSGAIITCNMALDQGKEVFAVPGNITSGLSQGPHAIIRDGGRLAASAWDILTDLGLAARPGQQTMDFGPELSDLERKTFLKLNEEPARADELSHELNVGFSEISGVLLMLEMKGLAKQLPGQLYVRASLTN